MIQQPNSLMTHRPLALQPPAPKLSTPPAAIRFGQDHRLRQTPPQVSRLLKHFDFAEIGNSHVKQIQLVYAACILWRLVAANERRKASPTQSYNEIRESALRDSVGYAFWFFGTPLLQRAYLKLIPEDYSKALIKKNPQDQAAKGILQRAKSALKQWNPITGYAIPSSEQIKDLRTQALQSLDNQNIKSGDAAFKQMEAFYDKLVMHRNMATGIGLLSTILLLGIGINYLNFYLTQKNVENRKKALLKPPFPPVLNLPKFQPPAAPAIPPTVPVMPAVAQPSPWPSSVTVPFRG